MYILKKNSKRKFTPIRGRRQRILRLKKIFLFLLFIAVLSGSIWGLKKVACIVLNTQPRPSWLEWHIKSINITGETGPLIQEVQKYITVKPGDIMTHTDAVAVQRVLKINLKELKKVRVWRNYFNGSLNIKIKRHIPFALILGDNKNYLMEESGLIFPDDKSPENEHLFKVKAQGKIKDDLLPKELVELVKALKTADGIDIEETLLNMDKMSFSLILKEGKAEMGDFKNGPLKIAYLMRVLKESGKRGFKTPFEINFNYFNDGKVYLKPTV